MNYCANLVRQVDHDRFILSLFYKGAQREALFALFAFNHEIAKTREVVTETATGLIRLQWWRDAVEKIYVGEVLEHEVVKPLAAAIREFDLPQDELNALIYAREFDVEDRQPPTMDGFLKYIELTTVPLLKLVLKVLGEECDGPALHDIAIRYGGVGCLRAAPYHLQYKRCILPEDIMRKHDTSVSKLYDWKKYESLRPVCEDIISALPKEKKVTSQFLRKTNVLSAMYIRKIGNLSYDLFDKEMAVDLRFKALRLFIGF